MAQQGELFGRPHLQIREAMIDDEGKPALFVVGCGRRKLPVAAAASDLYVSKRFQDSVRLVGELGGRYLILSAKHGIIDGSEVLDPYDRDVLSLDEAETRAWAKAALGSLQRRRPRIVTILSTAEYSAPLVQLNQEMGSPLALATPWADLSRPDHDLWLKHAHRFARRLAHARVLYEWVAAAREEGRVHALGELYDKAIPERGVYLFLDPNEPSPFGGPRLVRVGTHAVSEGSKTSLRTRLRNHLGNRAGGGSHRGSIFRLHVGRALLQRDQISHNFPNWGVGQDAPKSIRASEAEIEARVSTYLSALQVASIPILDQASKTSARALAEDQIIALFTENLEPIEKSSAEWLGLYSPVSEVRCSGLWNIRAVGNTYNDAIKFLR